MVAPFAGVSDSNDKVSERKKKVVKKSVTRQKTALCGSIKPFQNGKSEREGNLLHHKHSVCVHLVINVALSLACVKIYLIKDSLYLLQV